MSVREPVNPHVMALHYRVARNDDVNYRSTQRSVHRRGRVDVVMDGGEVTLPSAPANYAWNSSGPRSWTATPCSGIGMCHRG